MIRGKNQDGPYRIDARFSKSNLILRIQGIGAVADRIEVRCEDACRLLRGMDPSDDHGTMVYIYPPYYNKGSTLYLNHYGHEGHVLLSETIRSLGCPWALSYDNTPEIVAIYSWARQIEFEMRYNTYDFRAGRELFYTSDSLVIPCDDIVPCRGGLRGLHADA